MPRVARARPRQPLRLFQPRGVLAGAYRGFAKRVSDARLATAVTHWLEVDPFGHAKATATLCRRVKEERLADPYADPGSLAIVDCPACVERMLVVRSRGPVAIVDVEGREVPVPTASGFTPPEEGSRDHGWGDAFRPSSRRR